MLCLQDCGDLTQELQATRKLREEQDKAYLESLRVDRAKVSSQP